MTEAYQLYPIGIIHNKDENVFIEIFEPYLDAMHAIDDFSHFTVLYWLHENDTPEKRKVLQVNPRKDPKNPVTGVFGTHSPLRPNPVALTFCKKISIEKNRIYIEKIDAFDGSPLIDIKAWLPEDELTRDKVQVPAWV